MVHLNKPLATALRGIKPIGRCFAGRRTHRPVSGRRWYYAALKSRRKGDREDAMTEFTRRSMLTSAAALGAAAMTPINSEPAHASASAANRQAPGFYRYKVGDYEITVVTDGATTRPLEDNFVINQKKE